MTHVPFSALAVARSLAVALALIPCTLACGQVLRLGELSTPQVAALDRSHTVIVLTNGIVEEHGPYLPTLTDGYLDEALAQDLGRSIVARPAAAGKGWTVLLFPTIPLGVEPANAIAHRYSFPGSFTIRHDTMRDVFMDLADVIGQQDFRFIFIVDSHGGPANSRALDQASDYFHDTYHGRMVHLLGLMPVLDSVKALEQTLTPAELAENGMSVHADALEQSVTAFLRPDLTRSTVAAPTLAGADFAGLMAAAAKPNWPGYLGAPRLASQAMGGLAYSQYLAAIVKLAPEILDGRLDPATLPRYGDFMLTQSSEVDAANAANEATMTAQHQRWLASHAAAVAPRR